MIFSSADSEKDTARDQKAPPRRCLGKSIVIFFHCPLPLFFMLGAVGAAGAVGGDGVSGTVGAVGVASS